MGLPQLSGSQALGSGQFKLVHGLDILFIPQAVTGKVAEPFFRAIGGDRKNMEEVAGRE